MASAHLGPDYERVREYARIAHAAQVRKKTDIRDVVKGDVDAARTTGSD